MTKAAKKTPGGPRPNGKSVLAKRYGSIAEIKRDLFPNAAAADEAEAAMDRGENAYEALMDEVFGPR